MGVGAYWSGKEIAWIDQADEAFMFQVCTMDEWRALEAAWRMRLSKAQFKENLN